MRLSIHLTCGMVLLSSAVAFSADYNLNSSSTNGVLIDAANTGTTNKINLNVVSQTQDGVGMDINVGDGSVQWGNPYGIRTYITVGEGGIARGNYVTGTTYDPGTTQYGVQSEVWASGEGSYSYGVFGQAAGSSYTNNYGVYGFSYIYGAPGFTAAGYFAGDVYADNYYYTSDRKFKKDIQDVGNGLGTIMALKPRTYTMRVDEFKGSKSLPKGKQLGFIAQELETVLPELVTTAVEPPQYTKEEKAKGVTKTGMEYRSVNYVGVIPVLVKAMQEQQALIESMRAEIASLKAAK